MIPRMRTIQEATAELKIIDPSTAITCHAIRCMVLEGTIPHVKAGTKRLINLDMLLEYLSAPQESTPARGGIRPISERTV